MKIGIAGTGRMGAAIALRLLSQSYDVTVWNRSPEKAQPLVKLGAATAASPKELAEKSEAVITILTDAAALALSCWSLARLLAWRTARARWTAARREAHRLRRADNGRDA